MTRLLSHLCLLVIASALVGGCNLTGPDEPTHLTPIRVVDTQGRGIAGVQITGGALDQAWSLVTANDGTASIPVATQFEAAFFSKTNYMPRIVNDLTSGVVVLERTRRGLTSIGGIEGTVVAWMGQKCVTMSATGVYRHYAFTASSVEALSTVHLSDSLTRVSALALCGDTLWVATPDHGLFIYSIRIPAIPQPLGRVAVTGHVTALAVHDSILAVATCDPPALRILVHEQVTGAWTETHAFDGFGALGLAIHGGMLSVLGDRLPTIIDLTDPGEPRIAEAAPELSRDWRFVLNGVTMLLIRRDLWAPELRYLLKRCDAMGVPRTVGTFNTEAPIQACVGDTIAISWTDRRTLAIMTGTIDAGFSIASVIAGSGLEYQGASPPWYVVGGRLWKMQ